MNWIDKEHWEVVPKFVIKCETCEEVIVKLTAQDPNDSVLYHRIRQFDVICHKCKEKRKELVKKQ